MEDKEKLKQELTNYINSLMAKKKLIPDVFLEYTNHFSTLDNDTLVFLLTIIKQNDLAILAINTILKARGGTHNKNLVEVEPDSPN